MKYTAGPWTVAAGPTYCAIRTDARVIADMRLVGLHYNKADAHLIAAAPELLEALKLAVRQNSHDMLMTGEELRKCEAAIDKATRSET
jgi:hypothetical protein